MRRKHGCSWAVVTLGLALAVPQIASAGPFFGDWGWCWHPCRDCPRGDYSHLHYWTVGLYKARAVFHPSSLDQYPPGPSPTPPIDYLYTPYPCRTTPPAPAVPYADPAAYFGRPTNLPFTLP
jgi:hypothetical protein